jgi:predicted 3-demethylubiquinone-9 3-methyltransferase (glyoxalase superfamily)
MQSISTFLMFDGKAEEAVNFYVSIFKLSHIINIDRYNVNEHGTEGTVKLATFSLKGQELMCIDSSGHKFGFTPSMSLFVNCDSEDEIDSLYENLSRGGQVMMPLQAYPFSKKYSWVSDKYGVSWQLSLTGDQ